MKIIKGFLNTFSASAVLLAMTLAISAQTAAPAATPKPPVAKPVEGFDFLDSYLDDLEQAEVYFRRASNCDAKKDYACAIENYSGAIKADASDARFYFARGKDEMYISRDAAAIADLNKGLVMDPKHDAAFLDLGILYETTGQFDKAIDSYRSAVKTAPTPTNYILLARSVNRIFKAIIAKNEKVPATVDLNEALMALNAALKIEPDDHPVNYLEYQERAVTYRNLGRNAAAESDEKKATEQQTTFLKQVTAKTEAVVAAKEKELAIDNSIVQFFKAKDFAGAVQAATNVISQNPTMSRAYNERAQAYVGLRKYREAIVDATKAIEIFPTYSDGFATRGAAKMRSGDFAGALNDLDRAVELDPANIFAISRRGPIYMFKGKYELAEIDLLRVLDLDPKNERARQDLASLAELRAAGYNTGKVKDDALLKYVEANDRVNDFNADFIDRFNIVAKATNEQPRDNPKVCRLLADADVSLMVLESFVDKLKELVNTGRMDNLTSYKRDAQTSITTVATYRPTLNAEFPKQGCGARPIN